ncbi:5E5 antigen-like [Sturnira hondurensis]|uniref:5E5 antigen-like n=1 Tax=Sturnira hondurensis TaxID=192404 RepID=UPI00187A2C67|nr:5E5 antigen-like [Sturnira hondurensis]
MRFTISRLQIRKARFREVKGQAQRVVEVRTPAFSPPPQETSRPGRAPGPVPARLADRAGNARFRQDLETPAHSSWHGRTLPGRARGARAPESGALALSSAPLGLGKRCPQPHHQGEQRVSSRTPGSCHGGRRGVRTPDSPRSPQGPTRNPASQARPVGGRSAPRRASSPDSSPATSSGRFPKLNSFLRQLCAALPRQQLSLPNFGALGPARRLGGEGWISTSHRWAAPSFPDSEGSGIHTAGSARPTPVHGVRAGKRLRGPTQARGSAAAATAGRAAGGGAAKETCHSRRGWVPRPDGPGPTPRLPIQGPTKFLTCRRRSGRECVRIGDAVAAAEPVKRSRPSLRREDALEYLQAPRPRRRPPRLPSTPAVSWLRARVWSRGTFCLGAGERPPPPGSPPPAFPTPGQPFIGRPLPIDADLK